MSSIGRAIAQFNIVAFLRDRAQINELVDEVNLDCLRCSGAQKMYVNKRTKLWICHKCGECGNLVDLVERVTGLSMYDAVKLIVNDRNRNTVLRQIREVPEVEVGPTIGYPEHFKYLAFPEDEKNTRYWKYLRSKKRGVLASVALEYKLGYCPRGRYGNRIVIPVYWFGELVSWVARSLSDKVESPKLTPYGNKQSNYLLNLDRLWGKEEIVLVEGPFDMLKLPDVAVASFGKRISNKQIGLLTEARVKRVVIAYDSDALKDTWETARKLAERFNVAVAQLPDGEDPGSLPELETRLLVKSAIGYSPGAYWAHKARAIA